MATFTIKYAPTCLNDIVFANDELKHKFERYSLSNNRGPVLLHGPSCAGKTSIATVLSSPRMTTSSVVTSKPKAICYCEAGISGDLIDDIRYGYRYKSIILDRIHYLKISDQEPIVSCIDRIYQQNGYSAILTTNNLQKVHPDLKSLCELIYIPLPDICCWFDRVRYIIDVEEFIIPDDNVLSELLSETNGDGRKVLCAIEDYVSI